MICGSGGSTRKSAERSAEAGLKRSFVVILASIAAMLLWIEHGQRIVTDAPTPTELAALAVARACPDSENVPYSENCIAFMQGDRLSPTQRWRVSVAESALSDASDPHAPACPSKSDNVPYTTNCIRFMSGWFWRPNTH
jgi:hypothetical protein